MPRFDPQRLEDTQLLSNSPERMLNTSIKLSRYITSHPTRFDPTLVEDAFINLDDLLTFKDLITKLWNNARNQAFIRQQESKP